MVNVMYKSVFRSVLAGIGFSVLFINAPAGASPRDISSKPAAHHSADLSSAQEFSSRRRSYRHTTHVSRHRQVRSFKYVRSVKHVRSYKYARSMKRVRVVKRGRYAYRSGYTRRAAYGASRGGSVSLAGVVGPLASKARQIMASCGSRVVSGYRAGDGHSHHSTGNAVDLQGNPSCIYSMLRGWPGGVTTDYASAPGGAHVHVSYAPGGREWGLRFAHGGRGGYSSAARRAYARAYTPRAAKRVRSAPSMMQMF
jgi:hypothetical protein